MSDFDKRSRSVSRLKQKQKAERKREKQTAKTLDSKGGSVIRSDVDRVSGEETGEQQHQAKQNFTVASSTREKRQLLNRHLCSSHDWWADQLQNAKVQEPSDVCGFIEDVNWWLKAAGFRIEIRIIDEEDGSSVPVLCTLKSSIDRHNQPHLQINGRYKGGSISRGFRETDFTLVPVIEGLRGAIMRAPNPDLSD